MGSSTSRAGIAPSPPPHPLRKAPLSQVLHLSRTQRRRIWFGALQPRKVTNPSWLRVVGGKKAKQIVALSLSFSPPPATFPPYLLSRSLSLQPLLHPAASARICCKRTVVAQRRSRGPFPASVARRLAGQAEHRRPQRGRGLAREQGAGSLCLRSFCTSRGRPPSFLSKFWASGFCTPGRAGAGGGGGNPLPLPLPRLNKPNPAQPGPVRLV